MSDQTTAKHIRDIDIQKAAENTENNVYNLIVLAAARAREIAASRNKLDAKNQKLNKYEFKPINQALDEFQHNDV